MSIQRAQGVLIFLVCFNNSAWFEIYGVTRSSSRRPFLCALELSLPPLKLARIRSSVNAWLSHKAATKRATISYWPSESCSYCGSPGTHRLIDATQVGSQPSHFICLNSQVRSDLWWWTCFLRDWNGWSLSPLSPSVSVTKDASGSWGCGALTSNGKWF